MRTNESATMTTHSTRDEGTAAHVLDCQMVLVDEVHLPSRPVQHHGLGPTDGRRPRQRTVTSGPRAAVRARELGDHSQEGGDGGRGGRLGGRHRGCAGGCHGRRYAGARGGGGRRASGDHHAHHLANAAVVADCSTPGGEGVCVVQPPLRVEGQRAQVVDGYAGGRTLVWRRSRGAHRRPGPGHEAHHARRYRQHANGCVACHEHVAPAVHCNLAHIGKGGGGRGKAAAAAC